MNRERVDCCPACGEHYGLTAARKALSAEQLAVAHLTRLRRLTDRVCGTDGCDVALPSWDQHEGVSCDQHYALTARSQGHA
jgi:hypothetical protein